jgi:hypothetical protein
MDGSGADTLQARQVLPTGLATSRDQLEQQVLNDPRVSIYPSGRSLMPLGGASFALAEFALADHYHHIHIGN